LAPGILKTLMKEEDEDGQMVVLSNGILKPLPKEAETEKKRANLKAAALERRPEAPPRVPVANVDVKAADPKQPPGDCVLWFDGASQPNPGESGAGWIVFENKKPKAFGYKYLGGPLTNNQAEYEAFMEGLTYVKKNVEFKTLLVRGDSNLVVNQVQGLWQCKADKLVQVCAKAQILLNGMENTKVEHVPREKNTLADILSHLAVETKDKYTCHTAERYTANIEEHLKATLKKAEAAKRLAEVAEAALTQD
jgi:ribonuclease HI